MTVDQISVFVENRPGKLLEITELLGQAGVDIRAMSIADTTDFGILRIIVEDTEATMTLLKNAGYIVKLNRVLAVEIPDEPGSLAKILHIFATKELSIEYLYAFISPCAGGAYVIFRMENIDRASEVLTANGVKLASAKQLFA